MDRRVLQRAGWPRACHGSGDGAGADAVAGGAAGSVGGGQEVTRGGEVGRFVRWTFLTMGALLFGVFAVITDYDIYTGLRGTRC